MTILKKEKIKKVLAREILDSRGLPTIEVELVTNGGVFVSSAPSGTSKGGKEFSELRDKQNKRYFGYGVLNAIKKIEKIVQPHLLGKDVTQQEQIDEILMNINKNVSFLGTNITTPISQAVCRAGAWARKLELFQYISLLFSGKIAKSFFLPRPFFNLINGGLHGGGYLAIQEFLISSHKNKFAHNLKEGAEFYFLLKNILKSEKGVFATNVGQEGGFCPSYSCTKEVLDLLTKIIRKKKAKDFLKISLDCAASHFFKNGYYLIDDKKMSREQMIDFYKKLINDFSLFSLEDPFAENDIQGFKIIRETIPNTLIIGDDLLVSKKENIEWAEREKLCNGLLLKINQVGTVSEAIRSARTAKNFGWKIMVSHRSGETNDDFIADFAVGIFADYIKAGAPARGERVAKYNRLLKIEEILK